MEILLDKWIESKTWQRILIVIVCIILLPLLIIAGLIYFKRKSREDISESLVRQQQEDLDRRLTKAKEKAILLTQEKEEIQAEINKLSEKLKKRKGNHAEIVKRINNATSISELHIIASTLRQHDT